MRLTFASRDGFARSSRCWSSTSARAARQAQRIRWRRHFADSVGIGCYRIDLHPSAGGDNYIDISSLPFQIPMGSLIPRRVENLSAGVQEPRA